MNAIIIIVEPARKARGKPWPGVYVATVEGEERPIVTSTTPFLDAARALRARGCDDDVRLIMRWRDSLTDSLTALLGAAASIAVEERSSSAPSLRFVRYRSFPRALGGKTHLAQVANGVREP